MKLRNKVLLSITLIWAVFFIVVYSCSSVFLLQNFLNLENDRADQDLARIDLALNQMKNSLYTFTFDWSHWNDLYEYMQDKNPAFVKNNLTMTAYLNSNINLLTYWNTQDKLKVGVAVDTINKKLTTFPLDLKKYLKPSIFLLKDTTGYMLLGNQIMIVAITHITDSMQENKSIGTTIAGTYLTNSQIKKIEDITKLQLSLFTINDIKQDSGLQSAFQKTIAADDKHYTEPLNNAYLLGFTPLFDIERKPIGMIQLVKTRETYLNGLTAIHFFLLSLLVLGIIFSVLMIFLLRNVIIKRLEQLNNEVKTIGIQKRFSQRVLVTGKDELTSVAQEINTMMTIIQESQENLELRVKERTKELEQTNRQLETEIIERKAVQNELVIHKEHLLRLAHYDILTSLPNRILFNEQLNKALQEAAHHHKTIAILFIDLDRFKKINDALGHDSGDVALKEIAKRFTSVLRPRDLLARLGGDEFIILINDIDNKDTVISIAENLLNICSQAVKIDSYEFFITASIGICFYPNDGRSLEDLQRNADMAMYKAKKSGGAAYQFFTFQLNSKAHEQIKLEATLRKALSDGGLVLFYQPKLNLKDGTINGVEALIRLDSNELGLVSPEKFIPLAEETGLIIPIGEWALYTACSVAKSWQEQGYKPITMAVNISAKQFHNQDIVAVIKKVLDETKLTPEYLELEITESIFMDNLNLTIHKLQEIKKMGVKISLDDFGTGYTSMNYLKRFPIDVIKIDQSFVKDLPDNKNDAAIISAIIAMGHKLGIKIVAEGVETTEQLEFLSEHECDMIQGYYISGPLPEKKVILQFDKINNTRGKMDG